MKNVLKYAVHNNCSDVHVTQNKSVMVRNNGKISHVTLYEITGENIAEFIKSTIPHKYDEFISGTQTDIDASFEAWGRRFRINIYKSADGTTLAIRLLNDKIPALDSLSLPPSVNNFCDMETGLVLVVGTTGSGKTTTLAGIINNINRTRAINILTIEDPIEYVYKEWLSRIVQREIGTHTDTFANATRSAMRQDPDCVLIGELRDLETISNAITIAETGHLVFATIHAKSSVDVVHRILDVFPYEAQEQIRMQLSSVLRGVVHQKLISNSQGGRTPLVEILMIDDTVSGMIMQKQKPNAIRDYLRCQKSTGNVHPADNAAWHINNGLFRLEDVKHILSPEDYRLTASLINKRGGLRLS